MAATTPAAARQVVMGAMVATVVVAEARALQAKRHVPVRLVVGALIAASLLSAASEGAPEVASGMAMLFLVASLFSRDVTGDVSKALASITSYVSGKPAGA